jgi:NADPH2:quinone reductase
VNYPDVLIIEDKYQFKPERPFAPGGELSGVVESVGPGVTQFKVGDRVIGQTGVGGMASKIALPEASCVPMPDAMPFDEGAAFLLTYGTSYYALKQRARAVAGETLLVLGAAGGVGLAAVQLGKAMGLRVVAACSSQDKVNLAIKHGAAVGLVYPQGPFDKDGQKALADSFKRAVGGDGANIVYDAVGGSYAEASLRAIAWEGRFLVVGFPAGIPQIPLNLTLLKGCQIVGVFWGSFTMRQTAEHQNNVRELMAMYTEGKIKPYVSSRHPLAQAHEAIRELGERRAKGKVVVTMADTSAP